MTALRATMTLAGFQLRASTSARWVPVGAIVFAATAVAVTLSGLRSLSALGLAGAGAATDGLLHVALVLPPLIGLLLGAGSLARDRERGLLAVFASQPIRRGQLSLAAFLGSVAAVWIVVALGVGAATVLVAAVATAGDIVAVVSVLAVSLAASAAAVALGVGISSVCTTHHQATAAAAGLWLLLALGVDLLLAGVAPGLGLGPPGLLVAVLANPLEAARVLGLMLIDDGAVRGPFGTYLISRFGGVGTSMVLAASLVFWTVVPLLAARLATGRRDV